MRKWRFMGGTLVLFGAVWLAAMAAITMGLWNALLPGLLGVRALSFWQAGGVFLLSRILFGTFGGSGRWLGRSRFVRRWQSLTPDERERFRKAMNERCAGSWRSDEPRTAF